MADLFTRRALSLTSGIPEITGTLDLDPQTEWIEVAIDRPTSVSSGIVWASGTQIAVSIQVLVDGQIYEAKGRSSGGIRQRAGVDIPVYKLRWTLPAGYFGGSTGKRLGETRLSTFQVRLQFELLRGTTLTSSVVVTSASAPLILATRHNSVAYDNAASAIEESGDGVISFSITSTGSQRAALVCVGSRGTSLAGTLAITGGGETIGSTLWDVVDAGSSINSRGYPITNQATGAQTLTSDLTAATSSDHFLGIVTMTGVNQSAPTGNVAAVAPAFDTSPSCTVTGVAAADLVVDFLLDQGDPTVGANQTARVSPANTSFPTYFRMSTQSGADGGVMSWTHTGSMNRALNAVVFKAQPSAAVTGTATASITEADVVSGGKTVIVTLTDDTYIPNTIVTPVIEAADCTVSGSNTAQDPWAVSHPNASTGDLLIFYIAWDDSTATTDVDEPAGPNSEVLSEINATPVTDSSTETRAKAWYTIATGAWTAGTISFNPTASESWSATCIRVPAGEFDATTPIGAIGTAADTTGTDTTVDSPAFTAGASDGDGALVWCAGVDTDPLSATNPTGWTILQRQDLGAVAHGVAVRDTEVSDSESIASATWSIAGDSWTSIAFVVRAPATTPFEDARTAMRNGVDSAQSEATGWDALKSTTMPVANVVRTSDTVVTITLAAAASYNITAQETITVTVPASILSGGAAIVASPTFTIDPSGAGTKAPPPWAMAHRPRFLPRRRKVI